MRTYRIGIVGLGQRIAHVLLAMGEVGWQFETAFVDPAPVGAHILAEAGLPVCEGCASIAELLARGPLDLLMIGSPNHLHYEHLTALLEAGTPIFTEKPIVRTERASLLLARRLSAPGMPPVFVGLVMRSMSIVREVIARVDAGALGELISIDATEHLHPEHGGYLARNWRRRGSGAGPTCWTRSVTTSTSSIGSRAPGPSGWRASAGGASSPKPGPRRRASMTMGRPPTGCRTGAGAGRTTPSSRTWT